MLTITPKNLRVSTLSIFKDKVRVNCWSIFVSKENVVGFEIFGDNLFHLNHWDILANSMLTVAYRTSSSLCLKNRFVSLANMMNSAIYYALTMSSIRE